MAIQSMTGFARADGQSTGLSWVWELRSVNGKNLEIRLRLPAGYEELESPLRKTLASHLNRGNVQVSLQINDDSSTALPRINEAVALELWQAAEGLQKKIGGEMPTLSDLMTMKGVVDFETQGLSKSERDNRHSLLLKSFEKAAQQLTEIRTAEGQAVRQFVSGQVAKIENIRSLIDENEARSEPAIRKRLSENVQKLIESSDSLDPQRLHQEAAILAAKADLQEELDRLEVHVAAARELLSSEGPVGRRLDFLSQEFNRECNTICSKANAAAVTTLGLDMKIVIDQFREQIQNLE